MRYLILVGLIKYLTVERCKRYLILVGVIEYLTIERSFGIFWTFCFCLFVFLFFCLFWLFFVFLSFCIFLSLSCCIFFFQVLILYAVEAIHLRVYINLKNNDYQKLHRYRLSLVVFFVSCQPTRSLRNRQLPI